MSDNNLSLEDKISKSIDVSKNVVLLLKKKMNESKLEKDHVYIRYYIYEMQVYIFILSDIMANFESFKKEYSSTDLNNFFKSYSKTLKEAKSILKD